MITIQLHDDADASRAPRYEFYALAPVVSKFTDLDRDGEAQACRELTAAMDAGDKEAIQEAVLKVVGSRNYNLERHRAYDVTRRLDGTIYVDRRR